MTAAVPRLPWSLLRAKWLDVPVAADADPGFPDWGSFAEGFEHCLRDVSLHVAQRVTDPEGLETIVTDVIVGNLHLVVSPLGEPEKLDRLLEAADLLIARRAATRQLECHHGLQERRNARPAHLPQEEACSTEGE